MTTHGGQPGASDPLHKYTVDALLLDLDGTLIDSTLATERAWHSWGEQMGLAGFSYGSHGVPAKALVERYVDPPRRAEAYELIKNLEMSDTKGVVCKAGAVELLGSLPAGSWTIVTSCTQGLAKVRMRAAGILAPEHMVTAEQVAAGKPHPEPFLLGAERLGFDIRRCLVVEDAPAGLASARAAGAMTLAVAGTVEAHTLEADHVVESLSQVRAQVLANGRIEITLDLHLTAP